MVSSLYRKDEEKIQIQTTEVRLQGIRKGKKSVRRKAKAVNGER